MSILTAEEAHQRVLNNIDKKKREYLDRMLAEIARTEYEFVAVMDLTDEEIIRPALAEAIQTLEKEGYEIREKTSTEKEEHHVEISFSSLRVAKARGQSEDRSGEFSQHFQQPT